MDEQGKILEAKGCGDLSPKRKKKVYNLCLIKARTPNKQSHLNHAVTLNLFYFVILIKYKLLVWKKINVNTDYFRFSFITYTGYNVGFSTVP